MQCYEQFGWKPSDIPLIPESEADLLSIYFEETAAHQYRQNKQNRRAASRNDDHMITDLEIGDEE